MCPSNTNKKGLQIITCKPLILLVPEVGIEPTWGHPRWILSPVRLPVSPLRLERAALFTLLGFLLSRVKHAIPHWVFYKTVFPLPTLLLVVLVGKKSQCVLVMAEYRVADHEAATRFLAIIIFRGYV
jgi:hypothetical protein